MPRTSRLIHCRQDRPTSMSNTHRCVLKPCVNTTGDFHKDVSLRTWSNTPGIMTSVPTPHRWEARVFHRSRLISSEREKSNRGETKNTAVHWKQFDTHLTSLWNISVRAVIWGQAIYIVPTCVLLSQHADIRLTNSWNSMTRAKMCWENCLIAFEIWE